MFQDVIGVNVGMETDGHRGIASLTLCLPFNPFSEVVYYFNLRHL